MTPNLLFDGVQELCGSGASHLACSGNWNFAQWKEKYEV